MRSNCANCAQQVRTVGTHLGAYWQQVRTSGSHPLMRTWCEPDGQPVIKIYGCQALVSTVVSRVLQWFPLVTCPDRGKTAGRDRVSRCARFGSAPARRVEFTSPCISQHAGAGDYFDHALTECETGVRRNPRPVGVRGLFCAGHVKVGRLTVSHP